MQDIRMEELSNEKIKVHRQHWIHKENNLFVTNVTKNIFTKKALKIINVENDNYRLNYQTLDAY